MLIANRRDAAAVGFAFEAGQFVEVPDDQAAQLLAIKDAGFYIEGDEAPPILPHHEPRVGGTMESPYPAPPEPEPGPKVEAEVDKTETLAEVDPDAAEPAHKPAHARGARSAK